MKVVFCTPFLYKPTAPFLRALEGCLPAIEAQGWEHGLSQFGGNPYISNARSEMTRKAIDAGADVVMYLDYDVSWKPEDMVRILSTKELVVAGTYRFKKDEEEYMGGIIPDQFNQIQVNSEGCIKSDRAPAGFLKVNRDALSIFAKKHPHLLYGDPLNPYLDLFNHGAIDGTWWGEDYAFCKRWLETENDLWICPDIDVDHHSEDKVYEGNFHKYLIRYSEVRDGKG